MGCERRLFLTAALLAVFLCSKFILLQYWLFSIRNYDLHRLLSGVYWHDIWITIILFRWTLRPISVLMFYGQNSLLLKRHQIKDIYAPIDMFRSTFMNLYLRRMFRWCYHRWTRGGGPLPSIHGLTAGRRRRQDETWVRRVSGGRSVGDERRTLLPLWVSSPVV